jgi:hypothetical protein
VGTAIHKLTAVTTEDFTRAQLLAHPPCCCDQTTNRVEKAPQGCSRHALEWATSTFGPHTLQHQSSCNPCPHGCCPPSSFCCAHALVSTPLPHSLALVFSFAASARANHPLSNQGTNSPCEQGTLGLDRGGCKAVAGGWVGTGGGGRHARGPCMELRNCKGSSRSCQRSIRFEVNAATRCSSTLQQCIAHSTSWQYIEAVHCCR